MLVEYIVFGKAEIAAHSILKLEDAMRAHWLPQDTGIPLSDIACCAKSNMVGTVT